MGRLHNLGLSNTPNFPSKLIKKLLASENIDFQVKVNKPKVVSATCKAFFDGSNNFKVLCKNKLDVKIFVQTKLFKLSVTITGSGKDWVMSLDTIRDS